MKRLAAFAAILAMAALQSVALADDDPVEFVYPAEYTGLSNSNSYSAKVDDADVYSTVLITKVETGGEEGDIVYVDQADSTFTAGQNFLLKSNPAVGKYKVLLGSGSNNVSPKQTYFYVGVNSDNGNDLYMNRLQNEETDNEAGTCNIGYYATVPAEVFNTYNSIKVGGKPNNVELYGKFALNESEWETVYSGNGDLYLIFQLNDVPVSYEDTVAVYLSPETVSSSSAGGN